MTWRSVPLIEVAPPATSTVQLDSNSQVWHLTLDQIEPGTGRILNKRVAAASEAGNSSFVFDRGNVLYSKLRPYLNKVLMPNEVGIATTELVPLRPDGRLLDRGYLTFFLRSNQFVTFASNSVAGVKMPRVIMDKLWQFKIPLPPLSEQRRIVQILDQADALRKRRTEADKIAERILPELYYKMFGDPTKNPKAFAKSKLANLIKVKSGESMPVRNLDPSEGFPVYGGNGINGYHAEYMLDGPVVIIGRVGQYCGSVHYSQRRCWVTDNALFVHEYNGDLQPRYLAEALRVANLNQYASRAGQPLVSGNRIYPVEILVPPTTLQLQFVARVETLDVLLAQTRKSNEGLERLFSALLYRAFSGDLTSKWRKMHMKELLQEMEEQARELAKETRDP